MFKIPIKVHKVGYTDVDYLKRLQNVSFTYFSLCPVSCDLYYFRSSPGSAPVPQCDCHSLLR